MTLQFPRHGSAAIPLLLLLTTLQAGCPRHTETSSSGGGSSSGDASSAGASGSSMGAQSSSAAGGSSLTVPSSSAAGSSSAGASSASAGSGVSSSAAPSSSATGCTGGTWADPSHGLVCTPWQDCTAGTFVASEGDVTHDRACTACAVNTYSYASNQAQCSPPSCGNGHLESGEDCDGAPTTSCDALGFRAGSATCEACVNNVTGCSRPRMVDVAFANQGATSSDAAAPCALDAAGALRCMGSFGATSPLVLPALDPGPYTSIAGSDGALCAIHAAPSGTAHCWGYFAGNSTPVEAEVAIPAGASGAFLPDDPDAMTLRASDGQGLYVLGWPLGAFQHINGVLERDAEVLRDNTGAVTSQVECVVFTNGQAACFDNGNGVVPSGAAFGRDPTAANLWLKTGGPWRDIALGDTVACAIRDADSSVHCWTYTPGQMGNVDVAEARPASVPPRARSVSAFHKRLVFTHADGRVALVPNTDRSWSGVATLGAPSVGVGDVAVWFQSALSPAAAACSIDASGNLRCTGTPFTGVRGAPAGTFDGVSSSLGATLWLDPVGRVLAPLHAGDADLSVAPFMRAAGAATWCGVRDGTLRCTGGGNQLALANPLATDVTAVAWAEGGYPWTRPTCALHTGGALDCTSVGGGVDAVPAGTYLDVAVMAENAYLAFPRVWAVAVASNGTLVCWGDPNGRADPCARVPPGNNFVHVRLDAESGWTGYALTSTGELHRWTEFSTLPPVQAGMFTTYRGRFGIRADHTVANWTDPTLLSPPGTFLDVADGVSLVNGGTAGLAADGCGLRQDGTAECWQSTAANLTVIPGLPGTYQALAGGDGTLLLQDVSGATYLMGSNLLPQKAVTAVASSGFSTCWLDALHQLDCSGVTGLHPWLTSGGYPRGTTFSRLEANVWSYGANTGAGYCAFPASGPATCFGDAANTYAALGTPAVTTVAFGYWGSGYRCELASSNGAALCTGASGVGSFTPNVAPAVQLSLPSRDLEATFLLACRIRADGELECWGTPYASSPLPVGPFRALSHLTSQAAMVAVSDTGQLTAFRTSTYQPLTWPDLPADGFLSVDHDDFGPFCGITTAHQARCWGGAFQTAAGW